MITQSIKHLVLILVMCFANNLVDAQCTPTFTVFPPSCTPGCDGKVYGVLPPLSCYSGATAYNLMVSSPSSCGTVSALSNVGPGSYTLSNFCACSFNYQILLFDQNFNFLTTWNVSMLPSTISTFTSSSTTSSPTCFGVCNGSIQIGVIGGTAPYSYSVIPSSSSTYTGASSSAVMATSLCAGSFTVKIIDQLNCSATFVSSFNQPPAIVANSATSGINCFGACNGGFSISPTGGTPNYTVNFNPGGTFSASPGGTVSVTSLCASTVPVIATITDAKGCTVTSNYTVAQPQQLHANFTTTAISCFGMSNGCISSTVNGGTSPYTYLWSPSGANTASVCGLSAGNYTLNLMDSHNCLTTQTVTLGQPAALNISVTVINPGCSTCCNGTIQLNASGGTPPYTYTLLPGNISSGNGVFSNLCAGNYSVIVNSSTCNDTITAHLFSNITGLTKNSPENLIKIYPNPASNKISVHIGKTSQLLDISVYDSSGKLVYENKIFPNGDEVNLQDISKGIYILLLRENGGEVISKKFIIE